MADSGVSVQSPVWRCDRGHEPTSILTVYDGLGHNVTVCLRCYMDLLARECSRVSAVPQSSPLLEVDDRVFPHEVVPVSSPEGGAPVTLYAIHPMHGTALEVGMELVAMDTFPAASHVRLSHMMTFRLSGKDGSCAYAKNDCSDALRAAGVRRVRITEVGALSGVGQAVAI